MIDHGREEARLGQSMGSFGPTHQGLYFACVRVDCSNLKWLNDKKSYSPTTLEKFPLHCKQVIVFVNLLHDINTFLHSYKYPGKGIQTNWMRKSCQVNSRLRLTQSIIQRTVKTNSCKLPRLPGCNFVRCSKIMFDWTQKIVV